MKDELHFLVNFQNRGCTENKFLYRYFTRILPRSSSTLYPFFGIFQNTYFTKVLSIVTYDSNAKVLCNDLYNVILHACRNC